MKAELEGDRAAFFPDLVLGFFLHLLDDFLDARRMDAPVGDQLSIDFSLFRGDTDRSRTG